MQRKVLSRKVVFAQDRRKKRARNRAIVFFVAILSLAVGILLTFKKHSDEMHLASPADVVFLDAQDENYPEEVEGSLIGQDISLINTIKRDVEQSIALPETAEKTDTTLEEKPSVQKVEKSETADNANTEKKEEKENTDIAEGETVIDKTVEDSENKVEESNAQESVSGEGENTENAQNIENNTDNAENPENVTEQAEISEAKTAENAAEMNDEETVEISEQAENQEIQAEAEDIDAPKEELLPQEAQKALDKLLDIADQALRIQNQFSYVVTGDDHLRDVLGWSGLGGNVAKGLIKSFPELNSLSAGQQFYWTLDERGNLEYMNWLVSEKEERIYERKADGKFAMRCIEKKGEWRQDVVRGTFTTGFVPSLSKVRLSERQIQQLAEGLQAQIATQKLQRGDRFAILVKREYINGKVTDLGNVEGIHIRSGNKSYYAIQAANGRYYSTHGETLGSGNGFARQPLLFTARTSSQFNPYRIHPITKRVRPHNGVDFAVPIGTPIIAPSDGIVEHVAYQARGAGYYIRVRHGHITTVYMHLSKQLVKVGQAVRKGDRIALSGNSGGSTGPHLHYEFHINGQPVNPMTVKLPGSNAGMADKERKSFLARANFVKSKLKL